MRIAVCLWIVLALSSPSDEGTRRKFGTQVPPDARRTDVTILDVTGRAASVKVDAGPWVDYMHLVKVEGAWKILNVLWETR